MKVVNDLKIKEVSIFEIEDKNFELRLKDLFLKLKIKNRER